MTWQEVAFWVILGLVVAVLGMQRKIDADDWRDVSPEARRREWRRW